MTVKIHQANNAFVWKETTRIYNLWRTATDSTGAPEVTVDLAHDMGKVREIL